MTAAASDDAGREPVAFVWMSVLIVYAASARFAPPRGSASIRFGFKANITDGQRAAASSVEFARRERGPPARTRPRKASSGPRLSEAREWHLGAPAIHAVAVVALVGAVAFARRRLR